MSYTDWVKRFGQWHVADENSSVTLCGIPMLGNNYTLHIPPIDRVKCEICWNTADTKEKRKELQ